MHENTLPSKTDAVSIQNLPLTNKKTSIGELLIIEVFAGSCNLSATLVKHGFQAIAVDHIQSHKFRVMQLDLTSQHDQALLLDLIRHQQPFLVWMAPPCGTASRAKNIPVHNKSGQAFSCPLRSDDFPDGLPDLSGINLDRVLHANSLYELCDRLAALCDLIGIYWVLENPYDSYFWTSSWIYARHNSFTKFMFHNCMFGGARPKRTGLLANFDLSALAIQCDGNHEHAPWRSLSEDSIYFHTAEEAAYPLPLCTAIASLLSDLAVSKNFSLPPSHIFDSDTSDPLHSRHLLRGAVGIQPRGVQFSLLPSSFQDLWVDQSELPDICVPNDKLHSPFIKGTIFPPELQFDDGTFSKAQYSTQTDDMRKMKVLVPITPCEYLQRLVGTKHPSQLDSSSWGWYSNAVEYMMTKDQDEYLRIQARTLKSVLDRAKELSDSERKRKLGCDATVKAINSRKRLCLLEELLSSIQHPDTEIVGDLEAGFRLTGWLNRSGLFSSQVMPPQISRTTLESLSSFLNLSAIFKCEKNSAGEFAKELLDITLEEVEKGWIAEEMSLDDLHHGDVLSPRFIIHQGDKARAIDDFSFSSINATVGSSDKIALQGVDEIAGLIKRLMRSGVGDLLGRTYDMEAAYRQLPIRADERGKAIICIFDPESKKPRFFKMATMPFGAIASVHAFLRTAAAINNVCCTLFKIPVTSYFDDFTVITRKALAKGTDLAVRTIFEVLGLNLSTAEKKNRDFAQTFTALGVAFDLHKTPGDSFQIKNTDQRVEDLVKRINAILSTGKVCGREAKSLRSRLSFACSQLYGRTAAAVLKDLGRYECHKHPRTVDHNTRKLLEIMISHLRVGMPRQVFFGRSEVVHVFTDGSLEPGADADVTAGVGAVLVDEHGRCLKAFSFAPSCDQVQLIGGRIHQLEILPVIMACIAFEESLRSQCVYFHVDNSAAQSALINAGSINHSSRSLVYLFLDIEQRLQFIPWISRVNSASNIADGPSRNSLDEVRDLGAECFVFPSEVFDFIIKEFLKKLGGS